METVNIHYAKTHLSRLLERVGQGEEVIIAKSGEPIAKLIPFRLPERRPGRLQGRVRIAADFDAPLPPELAAAFAGEGE